MKIKYRLKFPIKRMNFDPAGKKNSLFFICLKFEITIFSLFYKPFFILVSIKYFYFQFLFFIILTFQITIFSLLTFILR